MKQPLRIGEAVRSPVACISRQSAATATPPGIKRISAHETIHTLAVPVVYATLETRPHGLPLYQHHLVLHPRRDERRPGDSISRTLRRVEPAPPRVDGR